MEVYSLKSPRIQQTLQLTPLVLELSLIQSYLLLGEFNICALCFSYSQSLQFSFLVQLGTHHCWVDRGSMIWEACQTPIHMTGSMTWAQATHPSTNQAQRCLTSVISWMELVTTQPCAPISPCYIQCMCFRFESYAEKDELQQTYLLQWLGVSLAHYSGELGCLLQVKMSRCLGRLECYPCNTVFL